MTPDEIIEMAEEAGVAFASDDYPEIWATYMHVGKKELVAFANFVAAKALAEHAMRETQRLGQEIEQEPIALHCCGYTDASAVKWNPFNGVVQCHNCGQTYTPPQRKPLTDDLLTDLWYKQSLDWMEFARAIEAAHGIKENA
jgi:ribosomal protein L37AE/L43A